MKNFKFLIISALFGSLVLGGCEKKSNDQPQDQQPAGPSVVEVTSLSVDAENVSLHPEAIHQIVATVLPENATDKTVSYSSDDTTVATVSETGLVTAVGNGTANITVSAGTFSKTVVVTVDTLPTGLSLDKINLEVIKGQTGTLAATVAPETSSFKTVNWSSENEEIATVDGGVVTGVKRGTTTITASLEGFEGEDFTKTATIEVSEYFAISHTAYEGLTLTYPSTGKVGSTIEVSVSEDVAETFEMDSSLKLKANDAFLTLDPTSGKYSFEMPEQEVVLTVASATAIVAHSVELYNADEYDDLFTVTGSTWESKKGHNLSFNVALKEGLEDLYIIDTVRLAGEDVDSRTSTWTAETGTFAFNMPNTDVRILIAYHKASFDVSLKEEVSGITLGGVTEGKAEYKDTVSVSYSPTDSFWKSHTFTGIKVNDGDLIEPTSGYSVNFEMPGEAVVITIVYSDILNPVTLTNSDHISLTAYKKVNDEYIAYENPINALVGSTMYVKLTNSDAESYGADTLKVNYTINDLYSPNKTIDLLDGAHKEGDYYFFEVPSIKDETSITIEVTESFIKFVDEDFLGNYIGLRLSGNNRNTSSFSDSYLMEIQQSGAIYLDEGQWRTLNGTVKERSGDIITLENDKEMIKHGNLLIAGYAYGSFGDITSSDMIIEVKLAEGTTEDDYKIYTERFLGDEYTVIQVLKKNSTTDEYETYESCLYVKSTGEFHFGVTFDFDEYTSNVIFTTARYDVYEADVMILSVYTTEGASAWTAASYRDLLDMKQGTYVGKDGEDDLTLVLDGKGGATLNGEAHTYEVDGDGKVVVVVDATEETTTYTFTLGEGTFELGKNVVSKLDGLQGTYTGKDGEDDMTLVLDGLGHATINSGDSLDYAVSEGKVVIEETVAGTKTTYTFTLDVEGKTFTLEKSSETAAPAFVEKTYSASQTAGSKTWTYKITFSSETEFSCERSSGSTKKTFSGSVSYNGETKSLVATIVGSLDYSGSITFTYDEENDKLTVSARNGDWNDTFRIGVGKVFNVLA